MFAVRASYRDGRLTLKEPAPTEQHECEVVVLFPEKGTSTVRHPIELRPAPASHLRELEGLASLGGNAMEDCERLYE
jgi:hypothetical protein